MVAILCSGQGAQHAGMFALTGGAPEASRVFAQAASLFGGRDPREVVATLDPASLRENRTGQILCTLQALAAHAVLAGGWPARAVLAGYSVGEIAAWGIAGLLSPRQALDLVAERARVMDAHSRPGDGLLFVRGLSRAAIAALCGDTGVEVAIVNPGKAFVVGGPGAALDLAADAARALGANRVVRVPVNVASHTSNLAAASIEFQRCLDAMAMATAPDDGRRLLSGIDGSVVHDVPVARRKLAEQISHPVMWSECLRSCMEQGASGFLELGPGRALSEMAALACPGVPSRSLGDFRSWQGVRDWLAALGR